MAPTTDASGLVILLPFEAVAGRLFSGGGGLKLPSSKLPARFRSGDQVDDDVVRGRLKSESIWFVSKFVNFLDEKKTIIIKTYLRLIISNIRFMWMKKQTITLESITCSELNLQIDKNQVQLQTSFSKQKLNDNKKN
jgi:hypothetical protein